MGKKGERKGQRQQWGLFCAWIVPDPFFVTSYINAAAYLWSDNAHRMVKTIFFLEPNIEIVQIFDLETPCGIALPQTYTRRDICKHRQ